MRESRIAFLPTLDRDPATLKLGHQLAEASLRQAQWVFMEHLSTKIPDRREQRALLNRTREYCEQEGALSTVRRSEGGGLLDGLVLDTFAVADDRVRKRRLRELYRNPVHFAEVTLAMIALFACFLRGDFYIRGVAINGIRAVDDRPGG